MRGTSIRRVVRSVHYDRVLLIVGSSIAAMLGFIQAANAITAERTARVFAPPTYVLMAGAAPTHAGSSPATPGVSAAPISIAFDSANGAPIVLDNSLFADKTTDAKDAR